MKCTYSCEDNKLRLYSEDRLDPETYTRIKAAGFIWAPKQKLFVAPMWTPSREDLLIELCGDIGDEDTSLVDRAEERAERFGDYSHNRTDDAERAKKAVDGIAQRFEGGQPILIGHHSEKRARKDAEKITNGMRKAVNMWEQAEYWKQRAAGAIRNAKYKERPDVRARRIKGLETDKRKQEKETQHIDFCLSFWSGTLQKKSGGFCEVNKENALHFCNYYDHAGVTLPNGENYYSAWSALDSDKTTVEEVQQQRLAELPRAKDWKNRWINHYNNRIAYERAMLAESGGTITDRKGPEKGGAIRCWASLNFGRGWSYILKVNKVSVTISNKVNYGDRIYTQTIPFDKIGGIMTDQEVNAAREAGLLVESDCKTGFYLSEAPKIEQTVEETEKKAEIQAMRDALKKGVKIVVAPQLFPTPPDIAERMVELAEIKPGMDILEPSAGTGNLIKAMPNIRPNGTLTVVEINHALSQALIELAYEVRHADFLECTDLGLFDRILMNPPFAQGIDILHIRHAQNFLKPNGRLVALCANGPRQREAFREQAEYWEDLPEGSFKDQGTGVNVALMVLGGK